MEEKIIRGSEVASDIREELKIEIEALAKKNVVPGLVTILVGENPASQSYVAAKNKTAKSLGIDLTQVTLSAETSEEVLLELIEKYNKQENIDGILVQLPLPEHMDESKVINAIAPAKDVDGFHPVNVGLMMLGEDCYLPCTPHGILELLVRSGVETSGAEVVEVGRSNIVGKPISNLMIQKKKKVAMQRLPCATPGQKILKNIVSGRIF